MQEINSPDEKMREAAARVSLLPLKCDFARTEMKKTLIAAGTEVTKKQ